MKGWGGKHKETWDWPAGKHKESCDGSWDSGCSGNVGLARRGFSSQERGVARTNGGRRVCLEMEVGRGYAHRHARTHARTTNKRKELTDNMLDEKMGWTTCETTRRSNSTA